MLLLRIRICNKAAGREFGQNLWNFRILGEGSLFFSLGQAMSLELSSWM